MLFFSKLSSLCQVLHVCTWLLVVQNLGVWGLPVRSAIPLVGFRKFDIMIFASAFHTVIQIKMISALQKMHRRDMTYCPETH